MKTKSKAILGLVGAILTAYSAANEVSYRFTNKFVDNGHSNSCIREAMADSFGPVEYYIYDLGAEIAMKDNKRTECTPETHQETHEDQRVYPTASGVSKT